MAKMLYDAMVAVDILAALPEVDPKRLCSVGHSLGAKEVLYLAAFDERIRATVSSEGGKDRVIRGGSWNLDAWSARCSRRFRFAPDLYGPGLGFRLVMEGRS
jgi:dienelactone hydrolase